MDVQSNDSTTTSLQVSKGRHGDFSKIEAWLNWVGYYGSHKWMPFFRCRQNKTEPKPFQGCIYICDVHACHVYMNIQYVYVHTYYYYCYYYYYYYWMTFLIWLDIQNVSSRCSLLSLTNTGHLVESSRRDERLLKEPHPFKESCI